MPPLQAWAWHSLRKLFTTQCLNLCILMRFGFRQILVLVSWTAAFFRHFCEPASLAKLDSVWQSCETIREMLASVGSYFRPWYCCYRSRDVVYTTCNAVKVKPRRWRTTVPASARRRHRTSINCDCSFSSSDTTRSSSAASWKICGGCWSTLREDSAPSEKVDANWRSGPSTSNTSLASIWRHARTMKRGKKPARRPVASLGAGGPPRVTPSRGWHREEWTEYLEHELGVYLTSRKNDEKRYDASTASSGVTRGTAPGDTL